MYNVNTVAMTKVRGVITETITTIDAMTEDALSKVAEVYDFEIDGDIANAFVKIGKRAPETVVIELA